jgi:hypothetical protein
MATCPDLAQNLGKPQVDGADHEYINGVSLKRKLDFRQSSPLAPQT